MINKIYTKNEILKLLKKEFEKAKILKLEQFFQSKFYEIIKKDSEKLKFNSVKEPDKFSFKITKTPASVKEILNSEEFRDFIGEITSKIITSIETKKFSHKDYTILHDEGKRKREIKACFFICENWNPDHGGNLVFRKKDGKVFYITPMQNTLCIIDKQKDWKEFMQYLNHLSEKKEIIVIEITLN